MQCKNHLIDKVTFEYLSFYVMCLANFCSVFLGTGTGHFPLAMYGQDCRSRYVVDLGHVSPG